MNRPAPLDPGLASHAGIASINKQRTLLLRMEKDVQTIVENVNDMLKAAKINDTIQNAQESYQLEIHSSRVKQSFQSLFNLVGELKQNAIFANVEGLNKRVGEQRRNQVDSADDTKAILDDMSKAFSDESDVFESQIK